MEREISEQPAQAQASCVPVWRARQRWCARAQGGRCGWTFNALSHLLQISPNPTSRVQFRPFLVSRFTATRFALSSGHVMNTTLQDNTLFTRAPMASMLQAGVSFASLRGIAAPTLPGTRARVPPLLGPSRSATLRAAPRAVHLGRVPRVVSAAAAVDGSEVGRCGYRSPRHPTHAAPPFLRRSGRQPVTPAKAAASCAAVQRRPVSRSASGREATWHPMTWRTASLPGPTAAPAASSALSAPTRVVS